MGNGECMKSYVYPAVLFPDDEIGGFSIAIYDLSLFNEGDTVEEAHTIMQSMLTSYVETSIKYGIELPPPTDFDEFMKKYPKNLCILVEAKLDKKNKSLL